MSEKIKSNKAMQILKWGCLLLLPIIVMSTLANIMIGHETFAISELNHCIEAREILGKPISKNYLSWSFGAATNSGGQGNASWQTGVKGPKGKGRYFFTAEKHGGLWALTSGHLEAGERGIDVVKCVNESRGSDFENEGSLKLSGPEALKKFIAKCADGDPNLCAVVGYMYLRGTAAAQDFVRARTYFEKACDLGLAQGDTYNCFESESVFENGKEARADAKEVKFFKQKIEDYDNQACRNGHADSCARLQRAHH